MEQIIKTTIKNEMPNIAIKTWEPNSLKALKQKKTKTEKRAENIMMSLRGKIEKHEEISLLEIKDEFKLNGSTLSKVINLSAFQEMLEEEGITMTKDKGKGNPIRFILPVHKV